jgi:dihydrofolate reductase
MRKVVLFLHASLDGFVEGPNGAMDIGWVAYDEEMAKFGTFMVTTVDTVLWGRGTYQIMEPYWPTVPTLSTSTQQELDHAEWINNTTKVVFSTTLKELTWNNSRLVKDNMFEEVTKLKQQPGKDILVLGSPRLSHILMQHGLIDEIKITVTPKLIGSGLPLFKDIKEKVELKLISNQTFQSGAIALHYEIVK